MTMLLLLEDHRCESAIRRGQSHNLFEARSPHKILKRHIGAKPDTKWEQFVDWFVEEVRRHNDYKEV